MTPNYLIHLLKQYKVINDDNTLSVKFKSRLMEKPILAQHLVEITSFLRGNGNCLKTRLHVLLQGITIQPSCKQCGNDVHMRLDGKYRYTFPTYCGTKCLSNSPEVKRKRITTNIEVYGVSNPSQVPEVREKFKRTMVERYGVENPMELEVFRGKRTQTRACKKSC